MAVVDVGSPTCCVGNAKRPPVRFGDSACERAAANLPTLADPQRGRLLIMLANRKRSYVGRQLAVYGSSSFLFK